MSKIVIPYRVSCGLLKPNSDTHTMKHFRNKQGFYQHISSPGRVLVIIATLVLVSGCSTVGYYSQIVSGHMKIVLGKRSLADVASDENIDESLKHRLTVAQKARQFGIKELGLPNNESYTSFYDTGKRFVTWNVVAAGEFSFVPRTWCFPIAGCVSYRGYYSEKSAQEYADNLAAEEGLDVAVNGATAYSTLGWFKDPLLNTMLERSDPSIASLLFHELAHQQLYVGDDSTFNESYASFVEKVGLNQWRQNEAIVNPQPDSELVNVELEARKKRREQFIALLSTVRSDLETLYELEIEDESKREQKKQRFAQMRADYAALKRSWDDYEGYDHWFSTEINNARLVSVSTYNEYIPAFEVMFDQSGGSLAQFYQVAKEVAELPAEERTAVMQELLGQSSQTSVVSQ